MSDTPKPAAGSARARRRLVSFLGTGNYEPTRHRFPDGTEGSQTRYAACALGQYVAADEVAIVATAEAKEKHGEGIETALREANLPAPTFAPIPRGESEAELWRQFAVAKELLRPPAGAAVALDITHAFRSQPFFAAAVAAFVRAVDPAPAAARIFYAAFEARREGVTPVWELTPFVELVDWAQNMMLFLRTGRAAGVAEKTEAFGRELGRRWAAAKEGEPPALAALGKELRAFGANLETIRTAALLLGDGPGSAKGLAKRLEEARASAASLPPLADVLDRLQREMVEPLLGASDHLASEAGHHALCGLARLYVGMGRWAEAAAVLREGWITRHAAPVAAFEGRHQGHPSVDEEARRQAEGHWNCAERAIASRVAQVRNDIEHAGFKRQPLPAESLQKRIRDLSADFAALPSAAARRQEAGATPIFVNLSNHPSASWSAAQREAARKFAPEIRDWPFPAVPPETSTAEIVDLADRLATQLLAEVPGVTHVMLQGEFTFAHALVRRLQQCGIVCLAATTRREVLEDRGAVKTTRFAFVRFREYG
ncbi:MAG TPA: TM1812 family CRISPR-associated protein [Stellaceae bacterium]|nr:TM1812 family CRISPR-associated protein [Stellaceae bacterium]